MDFKEIIDSWIRMTNPTENEKLHSDERLTICVNCVYYKEIIKRGRWSAVCTECSCPIAAKIFSNKTSACRVGNWDEVDKKYDIYKEVKTKKTIL
jgi:lipoate synthase